MTHTTLKDCPFCGSKPLYEHDAAGRLWLRCSQCFVGIDPQWYGGDLGTVEASWNKRVRQPSMIGVGDE